MKLTMGSLVSSIKQMMRTNNVARVRPSGLRPSSIFDEDNHCDMRIDITHADNGHIIQLRQETSTGCDTNTRVCMEGADVFEELKILISLGKLK